MSVCAPSADWDLLKGAENLTTEGIHTTTQLGNLGNGLYTNEFAGTSAATPLVAGIAALVLSANKDLPAVTVKEILEMSADKINGKDAKYVEGHSLRYGYGKVNAAKAVQMAMDLKTKSPLGKLISPVQYSNKLKTIIPVTIPPNQELKNKKMATTKIGKSPFVEWKFKCSDAAAEKKAKKRGNELLNYYLDGLAKGLSLGNRFYPKVSFGITNEKFAPIAGKPKMFKYSANVIRKSGPGATFDQPDSTKNPKSPTPPNP